MNRYQDASIPATQLINVQVMVTQGERPGEYDVVCEPEAITISSRDAIINYQIISPSPDDIQFSGIEVKPYPNHQFSHPSISVSGKLLTFSDANTIKETLNVTLCFVDRHGKNFGFDPQVTNDPEPTPPPGKAHNLG